MNELNKKLLERAGFKRTSNDYAKEVGQQAWLYPDGEWDLERDLPDFTESLDACFEWLVPKVSLNGECTVFLRLCDGKGWTKLGWICHIKDTTPFTRIGMVEGIKDPALAFCLAIEKLIDGEK